MIVDASVWVSGLLPQDAHHVRSQRWLDEQSHAGVTLLMPALALAEVAGAVARRTRSEQLGRDAIDDMMHAPDLRLIPLDVDLARAAAAMAATYRLRGADAVYAALADHLGLPLVTLDRELRARVGNRLTVLEPS